PLRGRLEERARQENEWAQRRRQAQIDFAQRSERLLVEVPACYFALCAGVRQAVGRFNVALDGGEFTAPLRYEETPGVILRDVTSDDLRIALWRRGACFELLLRFLHRSGKLPVPLIEGYGTYGASQQDRTLVRIEGWVQGGQTTFWYRVNFRRMEMDLAELPERITLSVVQADPTFLWKGLRQPLQQDLAQADQADKAD
ncbi:MAG: hypothetical protein NZ890_10565, partial [Myxococcota bacterium]|nr:hypothetical protein [Myxococcota bacterium]